MTTATATLADFLLARVVDDIVLARAIQAQAVTDGFTVDDPRRPELTLAARVLADCVARRAIVELHNLVTDPERLQAVWSGPTPGLACELCGGSPFDSRSLLEDIGPCETLRHLASVYRDHPAYNPAWDVS